MARLGPARVIWDDLPDAAAVVAFTDPATAAGIVHAADVRTLVTATKRVHEGKARYSVRVIDGASGNLFFRKIVELDPTVSAPERMSTMVAAQIYSVLDGYDLSKQKLGGNDPGLKNERAKELILAGKSLQDRRTLKDVDETIKCFQKAIAAEPRSALAYSWLSLALSSRLILEDKPEYLRDAEAAADIALRLNPDLGEAHRAKAQIFYLKTDLPGALNELANAFELGDVGPRAVNLAARISRMIGRTDVALAWYRLASHGESRPGENAWVIADCWAELADDEQATKAYGRASELFPYLPEGWMGLCRLALLEKDFARAQRICGENWMRYPDFVFSEEMAAQVAFFSRDFSAAEKYYQELATKDRDGGGSFYGAVSYQSALGRSRLAAGDKARGTALLQAALKTEKLALQSAPCSAEIPYRIAAIESSLGEKEAALSDLEEAIQGGWNDYRSLAIDPRFDEIRTSDRYQQIFDTMVTRVASLRRSTPAGEMAQLNKPPR
jgi:tetratricopeptide (TPR) repeat protein